MKVLQIIDSLPTGGGARFILNSVPVFNELGVETDVLLLDGTKTDFYKQLEKTNTCKIINLTVGNRWRLTNILKIIPYFKKYDLVHVHIFPGSYYAATAKMLSGSSTPLLFTEHNSQNRRAQNFIFKYFEKFNYSKFTKVICLTEQVQEFVIKNLKVNRNKLTVIENGISLEEVKNAIPYSKQELGFKEEDWLILMAARLESQKDHETLIKAMQLMPSKFKLLLAGDGTKKEELQLLSKNLEVSDRIVFLGDRSDILRIMKTCDAVVLSSHYEGLSLAALEALASGKPFIASDVPGLDFIKGYGILFKEGDYKKLSEILIQLHNNPDFYRKIAEHCLEKSKSYDVRNMVKEYIKVYKIVLNNDKTAKL